MMLDISSNDTFLNITQCRQRAARNYRGLSITMVTLDTAPTAFLVKYYNTSLDILSPSKAILTFLDLFRGCVFNL